MTLIRKVANFWRNILENPPDMAILPIKWPFPKSLDFFLDRFVKLPSLCALIDSVSNSYEGRGG